MKIFPNEDISHLLKKLTLLMRDDFFSKVNIVRYGNINRNTSMRIIESLKKVKVQSDNIKLKKFTHNLYSNASDTLEKKAQEEKQIKKQRELPHTFMLKRWKTASFYQSLNNRIMNCSLCEEQKIGFIPNYGMNFIDSRKKGMAQFRSDVFVVADPPLNFFVNNQLPPSPRACLVSGKDLKGDIARLIGSGENAALALRQIVAMYPGYVTEAPSMFKEEIIRAGLQMEKVIIASIGRCFITKGKYKAFFGDKEGSPIPCSSWIIEELNFLLEKSRPKSILLFSSHFVRIFLGLKLDADNLHLRNDLEWQGIPVRITFHPYQWLKDPKTRIKARKDFKSLSNLINQ